MAAAPDTHATAETAPERAPLTLDALPKFELLGITADPLTEEDIAHGSTYAECLILWAQQSGTDELWPIYLYKPSHGEAAGLGKVGPLFQLTFSGQLSQSGVPAPLTHFTTGQPHEPNSEQRVCANADGTPSSNAHVRVTVTLRLMDGQ